jgi:hypothetical protein
MLINFTTIIIQVAPGAAGPVRCGDTPRGLRAAVGSGR